MSQPAPPQHINLDRLLVIADEYLDFTESEWLHLQRCLTCRQAFSEALVETRRVRPRAAAIVRKSDDSESA